MLTNEHTLEDLQIVWDDVTKEVRTENKMAAGLMNSGKVLGYDSNILVVSFPGSLLIDRTKKYRHLIVSFLRTYDLDPQILDVVFILQQAD